MGATAFTILGIFALAAGVMGVNSKVVTQVASLAGGGFLIVAGIGLALAIIGFIVGLVMGKVRA